MRTGPLKKAEKEAILKEFLRSNFSTLQSKLHVSSLTSELYSEKVLRQGERESLEARSKAGWSESECALELLRGLERKSVLHQIQFYKIVGRHQPFLVQGILEQLGETHDMTDNWHDPRHGHDARPTQRLPFCNCQVTDIQLKTLSQWLPAKWPDVAVHLGMKTHDIERCEADNSSVVNKAYDMLSTWKRKFGRTATNAEIEKALKACELKGLWDDYVERFDNQQDGHDDTICDNGASTEQYDEHVDLPVDSSTSHDHVRTVVHDKRTYPFPRPDPFQGADGAHTNASQIRERRSDHSRKTTNPPNQLNSSSQATGVHEWLAATPNKMLFYVWIFILVLAVGSLVFMLQLLAHSPQKMTSNPDQPDLRNQGKVLHRNSPLLLQIAREFLQTEQLKVKELASILLKKGYNEFLKKHDLTKEDVFVEDVVHEVLVMWCRGTSKHERTGRVLFDALNEIKEVEMAEKFEKELLESEF